MFPVSEIENIIQSPDDYRLLTRIPWTASHARLPLMLNEDTGNACSVVILDVETTGFDAGSEKIIELGLVHAWVDVERGVFLSINSAVSLYEDPGKPIPEMITNLTGIDDEKVRGQRIDDEQVAGYFQDDPIVIAHSASFDHSFFAARFPKLSGLRWACSIKDVDWSSLGYEGSKLEYLCLKNGGFYEGHRASIDCLATAWLLHAESKALPALLASERRETFAVKAVGAPFEVKDSLKSRGYRWDADAKVWHTVVGESDLSEEQAFLAALYHRGGDRASITAMTSRTRYE
jgi:DNA polymerase-3 subunit epsilon